MPADYAHRLTEREAADMEEKIREIYREARDGLDRTVKEYFESFEKRDKEMRELIGSEINGKIWTEDDYKQWRLNQIGRGKRFEALRDEMAARYSDANELAIAYVNGKKPGIYAENRNYSAYTIEMSGANVSFTLFDESTVRRLIVEEPDLMPYYPPDKAHRRGIDLEWGKKQITKSVTSGILQGKSVGKIADDLQSRMEDMNRTSAIRTARTSATAAQNAGRMDAYTYAKSLGLDVRKQWLAIIDGRTRHYHAYLDGKIVETDEPFKVDGHEIRYPGDPKAAGYLIYNCRCTLLPVTEYSDVKEKPDISYPEWKKRLQNNSGGGIIKQKIRSGEYSTKLSSQHFKKHIPGTAQYEQYKNSRLKNGNTPQSIITISEQEAQDLILKYSGTGTVKLTASGNFSNVEFITADTVIGQYFDKDGYHDTDRMAIHYSKKSAHIVPVKGESHD